MSDNNLNIIKDLTEKLNLRDLKLREDAHLYKLLVEHSHDLVFLCKRDGTILYVNLKIEDFNFKRDNVLGKNFMDLIHPEDHYLLDFMKYENKDEEFENFSISNEIRIRTSKNKYSWLYNRFYSIFDGPEFIGFSCISKNINIEKLEEKHKNLYINVLEDIITKVPNIGVFNVDNGCKIIKYIGYNLNEIIYSKNILLRDYLNSVEIDDKMSIKIHTTTLKSLQDGKERTLNSKEYEVIIKPKIDNENIDGCIGIILKK
jgi:PAS domain S-box-containing protein